MKKKTLKTSWNISGIKFTKEDNNVKCYRPDCDNNTFRRRIREEYPELSKFVAEIKDVFSIKTLNLRFIGDWSGRKKAQEEK